MLSPPFNVHVITSSGLVPGRGHREIALAAVEGGAPVVQLRAPELPDDDLLPLARDLAVVCREARALLVVNDRLEVTVASGAAGVHLGQGDALEAAAARPPGLLLGVSVGSPEEAEAARHLGADYLGVTVWETPTKPEATAVGLEGLRTIVASTPLPVIGVGGITAGNADRVIGAGAAGVAVVSAVGAAPDPAAATRELVEVVRRATKEA